MLELTCQTLPQTSSPTSSAAVLSAIGAILAAMIIASVAYVGHRIAKSNAKLQAKLTKNVSRAANEQTRENARLAATLSANVKLADFRQDWLNSLRVEMATILSIAVAGELTKGPTREYSLAATKIELLMNPGDIQYKKLKRAMGRFLGREDDKEDQVANDEFVEVCQQILKTEWEVLKKEVRGVVDFGRS